MAFAKRPPTYNPPIVVEYDKRGQRVQKRFEDAYSGKRFYIAKYNAGKNPKVIRAK